MPDRLSLRQHVHQLLAHLPGRRGAGRGAAGGARAGVPATPARPADVAPVALPLLSAPPASGWVASKANGLFFLVGCPLTGALAEDDRVTAPDTSVFAQLGWKRLQARGCE